MGVKPENDIIIVSGLPRSGTSMMMRMLSKGGLPVLIDNIRTADEDNVRGYYEFEKVKMIAEDKSWLPDARGKAVKLIATLLKHLPPEYNYKIIFMKRKIQEILASQKKMIERRGEKNDVPDELMAKLFKTHLMEVDAWMNEHSNVDHIYVDYNKTMNDPKPWVNKINDFLGGFLDESEMVNVIDPSLYRQRK